MKFDELSNWLKVLNKDVILVDMSLKFTLKTYKKHLAGIKEDHVKVFWVKRNGINSGIFSGPDKSLALFYLNRYLMFDGDMGICDVEANIKKMINGDNPENRCAMCKEKVIGPSIPCTKCGASYCYNCIKGMHFSMEDATIACSKCNAKGGISFNKLGEMTVLHP
ncbi:MAG: hypothetical protein Hyperionvirus4_118 [Hyperionvirus sp.]|uniref:RING-type domain-containing protein n=1 Tax=Hyperionvirus sp. TaxID=2487770 RepID=A0A3G5ABB0_9VIRU|nr:MAG: hypothetical protein Hyperionvirus4_118 [Hyperionvirus sp.]